MGAGRHGQRDELASEFELRNSRAQHTECESEHVVLPQGGAAGAWGPQGGHWAAAGPMRDALSNVCAVITGDAYIRRFTCESRSLAARRPECATTCRQSQPAQHAAANRTCLHSSTRRDAAAECLVAECVCVCVFVPPVCCWLPLLRLWCDRGALLAEGRRQGGSPSHVSGAVVTADELAQSAAVWCVHAESPLRFER